MQALALLTTGERLVDFMRDGSGQFTHGRHACHMSEFRLRLVQLVLCPIEILNIRLEFSCSFAEFFFRALLCAGDCQDENGSQRKDDQTRYFCRIYGQRMNRSQEVVFERQEGKHRRQRAGLESTDPGSEHDCTEKQRNGRRLQIKLKLRHEQRCGNRQKTHGVTQHCPRPGPDRFEFAHILCV